MAAYTIDAALGAYGGMSGIYIPEIWAGALLEKFYLSTVFAAISNTDYEGEITAQGNKVIIRTLPDITINDHEIGQTLDYERPETTNVELEINKGKSYSFVVDSVEKKQSDINYIDAWSKNAAENMKIKIDLDVLAAVPALVDSDNAGTTAGAISGGVDLGVATTDGSTAEGLSTSTIIPKMVECGQVLNEQNIPPDDRWFVLPAWAITKIKTSELSEASYAGDGVSMKRNGRVGVIDTFEIFSSNNIAPTLETATNCYSAIFGHKSAITFASQLVENEMLKNPNAFGDLIRGLQVYGYKVVQPTAMGHLYCKKA